MRRRDAGEKLLRKAEDDANPLYVDVSSVIRPELTGVARFVPRTVQALARRYPLSLGYLTLRRRAPSRRSLIQTSIDPYPILVIPQLQHCGRHNILLFVQTHATSPCP